MTDRALNFRAIVDSIRNDAESSDESTMIVNATGTDPVDVCQAVYRRLEEHTDHADCEFYMSLNTRREMERGLVKRGPEAASLDFLERQIRTDVSMPDETVLFMEPDAVTLGGTITGSSPIGVGTISSAETE
ncbi:hypothetical protein [Natronorubrum texcoconense]|uniref:Uncharacterized protein n=1 Tax=Natronorubrum texcoconense TaxID=1095776 RepID=A0A1G8VLE6_9EURY|nr:hypothetical protein [Natronorubrum texcoconense]SDJ66774.1 hypothetical protein SAMN04515672_1393 [Natronorubrum texcoconense]